MWITDRRVQDFPRPPQPAQPRHPALVMVTDRRGSAIRRCTELSRTHKRTPWSVHLSIFSAVPLSFAILFLINRAKLPNSPGSLFIIFEHCRGCKGHSVWEKLPIEVFGMDSLQTAFSFCSCDGLVLSWLQMRFAFLICTPCWLRRRHGSEIAERAKEKWRDEKRRSTNGSAIELLNISRESCMDTQTRHVARGRPPTGLM